MTNAAIDGQVPFELEDDTGVAAIEIAFPLGLDAPVSASATFLPNSLPAHITAALRQKVGDAVVEILLSSDIDVREILVAADDDGFMLCHCLPTGLVPIAFSPQRHVRDRRLGPGDVNAITVHLLGLLTCAVVCFTCLRAIVGGG